MTPKKVRVLQLVADGRANKEIADILQIHINTVQYHISNLKLFFDADSRLVLIAKAFRAGVIK